MMNNDKHLMNEKYLAIINTGNGINIIALTHEINLKNVSRKQQTIMKLLYLWNSKLK